MLRGTVLVVEDDQQIRMDAATLLRTAGLDVVEMDNADDAFAYTLEQPTKVAAIFIDIRMAGRVDGADLARAIARAFPSVAVLVTSEQDGADSDLPGSVRYLPRPWRPLDVFIALQGIAA